MKVVNQFGVFLTLIIIAIGSVWLISVSRGSSIREVSVLYDDWIGFTPLVVAKEKGYTDRYRLDVELYARGDIENGHSRVDRNFDFSLRSLPRFIEENDPTMEIVAPIDVSNGGDSIVVRGDTDNGLKGQQGKKIIVYGGSIGRALVQAYMRRERLDIEDYDLVSVEPTERYQLRHFDDPDVVAVSAWEPYPTQLKAIYPDAYTITDSSRFYGVVTEVVITQKALPERAKIALVRALYDAIRLYTVNPTEYVRVVASSQNRDKNDIVRELNLIDFTGYEDYFRFVGTPRDPGLLYNIYRNVLQLDSDLTIEEIKDRYESDINRLKLR